MNPVIIPQAGIIPFPAEQADDPDRIARFRSALPSDSSFFAVLDPNLAPSLDELVLSDKVDESIVLYHTAPSPDKVPYLPRLVELRPDSLICDTLLERFGHGLGIMLSCKKGVQLVDVAACLRRLCIMINPEGDKLWLRFFEPYVMRTLLSTSKPDKYAALFGKVIESYILEDAHAQAYHVFPRIPDDLAVAPCRLPINLSSGQMEALEQAHYELFIYNVFRELSGARPDLLAKNGREEFLARVRSSAALAEEYGFQSMSHVFRFVCLDFRHGLGFDKSARFAALLNDRNLSAENRITALEAV